MSKPEHCALVGLLALTYTTGFVHQPHCVLCAMHAPQSLYALHGS